ncbi:ABC transporter permease [Demequina flava]|uniref:ABC transporter permease n=1 Tax=Demequina flava TaxID=1095025 RepID=UPI000782202F|nr:ABC transporter permease [Demequina flava]
MPTSSPFPSERYVAPFDDDDVRISEPTLDAGTKPRSVWSDVWMSIRKRPLFWTSAILISLVVTVAAFPSWFTSVSPDEGCLLANSDGPPQMGHPFGFTVQGCDVYSRVIYGARASVMVGLLAMLLATAFGGIVGALAGFYGGILDSILSRVVDIFFAIPMVLGAIVMMSVSNERTAILVAVVIAVFAWPQIARIARGAVLSARKSDYVTAVTSLGLSPFKTLVRHVVPNSLGPVIAVATVSLGTFIVAESTLSYLGIGLPASTMSWGNDISQAQSSLRTNPLLLVYPAGALSITVLSFLMLGDVLRDALDPKERTRR